MGDAPPYHLHSVTTEHADVQEKLLGIPRLAVNRGTILPSRWLMPELREELHATAETSDASAHATGPRDHHELLSLADDLRSLRDHVFTCDGAPSACLDRCWPLGGFEL